MAALQLLQTMAIRTALTVLGQEELRKDGTCESDFVRSTIPSRAMPLGVDETATGAIVAMSLFAGLSVGAVARVEPVAEIVRQLIEEAELSLGANRRAGQPA